MIIIYNNMAMEKKIVKMSYHKGKGTATIAREKSSEIQRYVTLTIEQSNVILNR